MKKILACVAMTITLTALASVTAFAGCHYGGSHKKRAISYSICATESCDLTGLHAHNGINYLSHYYGDGHTYHDYHNVGTHH